MSRNSKSDNLAIAYDVASNQDFADFVTSYYNSSISFYNNLNNRGIYNKSTVGAFDAADSLPDFENLSTTYGISLDTIKRIYSDPLAYFVYFLRNTGLDSTLSEDDMLEVVDDVFKVVLEDQKYINDNPRSPLLMAMNAINNNANTQNQRYAVTTGEAVGCVAAAAGAFIAENWGAIRGLVNVLKGESLSWGVVVSAAELFFPEVKGIWTICTFVACIINAAIN